MGGSGGAQHIVQGVVPAGTSLDDISLTYPSAVFGAPVVSVWTIPVANLNSTTAVDVGDAVTSSGTSVTFDLTTSADGVIIAGGYNRQATGNARAITGDEAYAERHDSSAAGGGQIVSADASGIAASAGINTVTFTFTQTSSIVAVRRHDRHETDRSHRRDTDRANDRC